MNHKFYISLFVFFFFSPKIVFAADSLAFNTEFQWDDREYLSIQSGTYPVDVISDTLLEGPVNGQIQSFLSSTCDIHSCTFDDNSTVVFKEIVSFANVVDFDSPFSVMPSSFSTNFDSSIEAVVFQNYSPSNVSGSVSCAIYDIDGITCLSREVSVTNGNLILGSIAVPAFHIDYHFSVKGNIANTDGSFTFQNLLLDSSIRTVTPENHLIFNNLSYETLEDVYNSFGDISYTANDSLNHVYSISTSASNSAVTFLDSLSYGTNGYTLYLDVTASLDSSLAHTGIIYDYLPFIILFFILLASFSVLFLGNSTLNKNFF